MSRGRRRRNRKPQTSFTPEKRKPKGGGKRQNQKVTPPSSYGRYTGPLCKHWQEPFKLEDGRTVYASAYFDSPPMMDDQGFTPDFALYFDSMWSRQYAWTMGGVTLPSQDEYPAVIYPWVDRQAPRKHAILKDALQCILDLPKHHRAVIGCLGAHGRTGTALACLLVMQGVTPREAINRVRRDYCICAIEGRMQEDYVNMFGLWLLGGDEPNVRLRSTTVQYGQGTATVTQPAGSSTQWVQDYKAKADRWWEDDERDKGYSWSGGYSADSYEFDKYDMVQIADKAMLKQADDEADYRQWLMLNASDAEYTRTVDQAMRDERDVECLIPPCIDKGGCVDECFMATMHNSGDKDEWCMSQQ